MKPTTHSVHSKLFWINLALLVPAVISVSAGVKNALRVGRSQDFQWSGAHLFALHRDPYLVYLLKDPGHEILKSQIPNYLQELYVLLWPLGLVGEHAAAAFWLVLNLLFAAASVLMLGRIFRLSRAKTLLLGLIFVTSAPFRVSIGNGQQSLLELVLLLAALVVPARAEWPLGFSYFKYSFAPIVFFYVACKKAHRLLLFSLILPIAGWLIFWLHVGGSPLRTAIEPLLVGRGGVAPGTADLVTLLMFSAPRLVPFGLAFTVLLSALLAYVIHRRAKSLPEAGAALAICSLFLFPHLIYDFVFLVVPSALLMSKGRPARSPTAVSILCIIGLAYVMPWLGGAWSLRLCLGLNLMFLIVLGACVILSSRPDTSGSKLSPTQLAQSRD